MKYYLTLLYFLSISSTFSEELKLNEQEYFETQGLNVMVFQDYYPVGHQGGVSFIQNGKRVATNGDLRLSDDPGQWQPVPKKVERTVDIETNSIRVKLSYPDEKQHLKGFNPLIYPELNLEYDIVVNPIPESHSFRVQVNLKKPLPPEWLDKVGFNLELFPGLLFGKSFYMDDSIGTFTQQPNGPIQINDNGKTRIPSLSEGKTITIAPGNKERQVQIKSNTGKMKLLDARMNHNNGWFVLREEIKTNDTTRVIDWEIKPSIIPNWKYKPNVHISQVGYHPEQEKKAVIEWDARDIIPEEIYLKKISQNGEKETVLSVKAKSWGNFLRYQYTIIDFSHIKDPGLYVICFKDQESEVIKISPKIFENHVWQPTLEYFLPVQMCHMRVSEKYKVWHDRCHLDDALMAPPDINHFDGYTQTDSTLCDHKAFDHVPGLDSGGWHDAGDYDLRIESQINTVYTLCLAHEAFEPELDQTLINQEEKTVEIHHPDGIPDILQQIEHGLLTVIGGYEALGRLYRGVITPTLRQYVMLGDAASMSDNIPYQKTGDETNLGHVWYQHIFNAQSKYFDPHDAKDRYKYGSEKLDDRLVFTEENPRRSFDAIAGLAASSRMIRSYNPTLSKKAIAAAESLWDEYINTSDQKANNAKIKAVIELILSTQNEKYIQYLKDNLDTAIDNFNQTGYLLTRAISYLNKDELNYTMH